MAIALVSGLLSILPTLTSSPANAAGGQVLTQTGYIWENDNGTDVDSNTQQAAGNTAITSVRKGERATARFQVTNTGSALDSDLGVFYDRGDNMWAKVQTAATPVSIPTGSCYDTTWDCSAVLSGGAWSDAHEMTLDPTGTPWIANVDVTTGELRVIRYVGAGGSGCTDAKWTCVSIDATGQTSSTFRPSIAFDKAGNPWVSYFDYTNGDLKVARYVGASGTGCSVSSAWTCTTIDSTTATIGYGSSLAFDSSGNAWIAYNGGTSGAPRLAVARYVGSGGTGCGVSSAWTCTLIQSNGGTISDPSMVFDASGVAWIQYTFYASPTVSQVFVAQYVGSSGTGCSVSSAWTCTQVDNIASSSNSARGQITVSPSGQLWMSYETLNNGGEIRVARYVGSGGTGCSISSAWTCEAVIVNGPWYADTSLAFDPAGNAWMTYSPGYASNYLYLARYVGSGGSGCTSSAWTCAMVDSSSSTGDSSMAFDALGNGWISSWDSTSNNLRVARAQRGGEITIAPGTAGTNNATISESHVDMSTTADTSNRDDADCVSGSTWANGKWFNSENGNLSLAASRCTEVAFTLDTSQAIAGTTYRFVVAAKDSFDPGRHFWRGMSSVTNYATLTVESATTSRLSKDAQHDMSNCTSAAWGCASIETSNDVGRYGSIAIDSAGSPWISYQQTTSGYLRVAQYVGAGGTGCAITTWTCVSVDTGATTGQYTSMGFDQAGAPWVSYYDVTGGNLRIAKYVGSGGTGCAVATWTCVSVDTTNDVGRYSSIAFDPSGNPWISYYDTSGYLRVARYVASGGSGCASTAWTCTSVVTSNAGAYSSIAIDSLGAPWISYQNTSSLDLYVAHYVGSDGSGCAVTSWTCTAIHTTGSVGYQTSIAFDGSGNPWISYLQGSFVYVASYVGSGGTGCATATWNCVSIYSINAVDTNTQIAFDSSGVPWVAFADSHFSTTSLYAAKYVGSGGTGCSVATWTCVTIDNSGVGLYATLAFDQSGAPWIGYINETSDDLRVAKMHLPPTAPSYNNRYTNPGRGAAQGDARYRFDNAGYAAIASSNGTFDSMTATASEIPMFVSARKATSNSQLPAISWTGQSTVAFSSKAISIEVWNNTTKAWATPGSVINGCSATGANTTCTIAGAATGTASDFYETDGSAYWSYFRISQASGSAVTLRSDAVTMGFSNSSSSLEQSGFIIENDDGGVDTNTQKAAGNAAVTNVKKGERLTLRTQVANYGAAFNSNLGLFYDRGDGLWTQAGSPNAPITATGSCVVTTFDCTAVDTANTVGQYASMAIDSTGSPWVSYNDAGSNNDLRIAHYVGTGGTGCASATWNCESIDTTGTTGLYTSIAISPTGIPWISYYDSTGQQNLRVARFVGSGGSGCAVTSWTCESVDITGNVGQYTSIAFDTVGAAWVSYYDVTNTALKIAKYVGSGGSNCNVTTWTCTTVDDTATTTGQYSSIAFNSLGTAWVSYYDSTGDNDLKVATYVGSNGVGCTSTAWSCESVDTGGNVGQYTSIAFSPSGAPWVSYYDVSNTALKVARYVESGGTGCAISNWTCSTVDLANTVGQYNSLGFDPSGAAWVSYYDGTGANQDLRVARYVGTGGTGCNITSWTCSSIDTGGNTGQYTSLAFTPSGNAVIASYDVTNTGLRLASLKRNAELMVSPGLAGASGDSMTESHVDMSSTGDTSNRDDADCVSGGTWNNGKWFEAAQGTISIPAAGFASSQCTEVSFVVDTSQATAGSTYRFVVASKDSLRFDHGYWRGMASVTSYPSITLEAATTLRIAKDNNADFANCSNTAWGCTTIETNSNAHLSMAIDPSGTPWTSSFSTNAVRVSRYVGSGGTGCTSSAWTCTGVDAASGNTTSLAFDLTGTPWMAYYSSSDLRLARYVGSGGTGCSLSSAWTCISVDTTNDTGQYAHLAFDQAGVAWISYYDFDNDTLRVARYVGSGGSGCASAAWSCVTVVGSAAGPLNSIAFDTAGNPWISTYSSVGLMVVRYVGSGGTGCTSAAWTCTTVDSTGASGWYTGIGFDSSGNAWVSHHDFTSKDLRVAQYVGSGGTGCASAAWTCTLVDSTGDVGQYSSVAFDNTGTLWVGYYDNTNQYAKYARYVGSGGTGCASVAWTCTNIESQNSQGGLYGSLNFDKSGTPWMAYRESVSGSLKVAKMHTSPTPLSYQSRYTNSVRNATQGDARYRLDLPGNTALATDDTTYDTSVALANEVPSYTFAQQSGSNASFPNYQWTGSSSVSNASKNTHIQVYRFGSTNGWVTLQTNSSTGASTFFTLTGTASAGTASEYWEADGSNYWTYYRIFQDANSSGATLTSDYFGATPNTAPLSPSSLDQKTTSDVVISTGGWNNSISVKFTATVSDPDSSDTLQLCVEAKPIASAFTNAEDGCTSSGVAYSGSGVTATVTLTLTDTTQYHWQARTKDVGGLYSSWVSYGANSDVVTAAADVGIDTTAPTGGTVYDGTAPGIDAGFNTGSITTLSANWASINANVSGLAGYEYSIGTTPGGTTIKTWTSNGTSTSVTASGLSLQTGALYYFNVRTTDNAGNISTAISSDGQMVAPTLTLDLSSNTITFAPLNSWSSYTDTQSITATVSTNAYNGYQITQYASGLLTSNSNTIPMYAGTWASPTTWSGTGLGYTSDDTSVSGSNRFSGATKYAGVNTSSPGDIVADSSTHAVSGDVHHLTYKVTTSGAQPAGNYVGLFVISAIASF